MADTVDPVATPGAYYDQALWVDSLRHGDDDPAALLALFEAVRARG